MWWTWTPADLTAILFALSLGYLALRRAIENPHSRALVSAMVALLMALTVVVDHYATSWWVTLHQGTTLLQPGPTVHGGSWRRCCSSWLSASVRLDARPPLSPGGPRGAYEQEGFSLALEARRAEASGSRQVSRPRSGAGRGAGEMNYVVAAWLSCGAILLVYALRTLRRERLLRRSLAPTGREHLTAGAADRPDGPLVPEEEGNGAEPALGPLSPICSARP